MYAHISFKSGKLKGIWLDIANMFHNLGLPCPFFDLLPLPTITFGELSTVTQQRVQLALNSHQLDKNTILRPSQRTMHMGFKWSVVLAHDAKRNIIRTAYSITSMSKYLPTSPALKFMCKTDAPSSCNPAMRSPSPSSMTYPTAR